MRAVRPAEASRAEILIAVLALLAVALTANTITVSNETKAAEVTADGGEILELSNGDVQVVETPAQTREPGAPIVLLHCYAVSMHWWDSMVPLLSEDHRVITIDLLGHGGSEKPAGGYCDGGPGVARRGGAQRAARPGRGRGRTLDGRLGRHGAREQSSELVDRVVIIDRPHNDELRPASRSSRDSATCRSSASCSIASPPIRRSRTPTRTVSRPATTSRADSRTPTRSSRTSER